MTASTTTAQMRLPMILTGHALQSLRDSGYTISAALAEPIDNSLEAAANNIVIKLEEAKNKAGKKHIHRIVIADDGSGMDDVTLHHYLQLGYSTRYMSKKTIGKYGVGAKLAALNFGKRIDVWSRTSAREPWQHVFFDLDSAMEIEERGEVVGIDPPAADPVPDDLQLLLASGSGTIVVWSNVERLEEGRFAEDANKLRVDVEKELSRMFRYFLKGGIHIRVNDTDLLPHDPLFQMEGTWTDSVLAEHFPPTAGHFPPTIVADKEPIKVGGSAALLTVTVYPRQVLRERGKGGDKFAEKLRVPENEGNVSFIRMDREIAYTNVPRLFPRGVQEPDRFIGIEVAFKPDLDEFFGVRNVKRGVEPHGELRDKIRERLKKYLATAREEIEAAWGGAARQSQVKKGEHGSLEEAVKDADRTLPKARIETPPTPEERERILEDLAKDVGIDNAKEKEEFLARIKELPFVVESVDFPGTNFIDIQHLGNQVIIRLNTRHRFYREMWEPMREIATASPAVISGDAAVRAARRTLEAMSLLIVAYGKAESMDRDPHSRYGELRGYWGQFLDSLMGKVKNVM